MDGQLAAPATAGHVRVPSTEFSYPASSCGRPSAPMPDAQVRLFHERFRHQHPAGESIEHVEEPVPIGDGEQLPWTVREIQHRRAAAADSHPSREDRAA